MLRAILFPKLFTLLLAFVFGGSALDFTFNGFRSANLSLDGISELTSEGLLILTNGTIEEAGHAFFPDPITFKNSSNGEAFSFSTTFVFAIRSELKTSSTDGLAFVIAPTKVLPLQGSSMGFLGLFNQSTNGTATNHIFAVELDTIQNSFSNDKNNNHVGIDIDTTNSEMQETAGYHDNGSFENLTLWSGVPMQVWVDYDGTKNEINVTLAPFEADKPRIPLLNLIYDLSAVLNQNMYVGFSSSTGPVVTNQYVLGWSFRAPGREAPQLYLSQLPALPRTGHKKVSRFLTIGLPLICLLTFSAATFSLIYFVRRKRKFAEVLED